MAQNIYGNWVVGESTGFNNRISILMYDILNKLKGLDL